MYDYTYRNKTQIVSLILVQQMLPDMYIHAYPFKISYIYV